MTDLLSIWIRSEIHMRVDKKMLKDVIKLMDSCLGKVPQKKGGPGLGRNPAEYEKKNK